MHINIDHGATVRLTARSAGPPFEARGQSLVEFALILPILILMLFGIVDLGRGVFTYTTIDNAARQGARVAAVNQIEISPDCDQSRPIENPADPHWSIKTCAATSATGLGVTTADVTVSYFPPPGNALLTCSPTLHVGCIARVTVQNTFRPATPIIGNIVGNVAMSSTAEVPVERVFP